MIWKRKERHILYSKFNPVVANADEKYYPKECAFGFEAMSKKLKLMIDNEKKLQILFELVPVSVSIFSTNVTEYDDIPIFICDSNPKKLIKLFLKYH
jgi:hypothetical protein